MIQLTEKGVLAVRLHESEQERLRLAARVIELERARAGDLRFISMLAARLFELLTALARLHAAYHLAVHCAQQSPSAELGALQALRRCGR